MDKEKKHIQYLDELSGYKIASGYPDVRGWDVKDHDNRVIGKVDNLLVNKNTERVVYLDVEVDNTIISAGHDPYGRPANIDVREFVNKEGENHIIIPIGLVDLIEDNKYVYTASINHLTFAETKRVRKGAPIDREYEVVVLDSYGRRLSTKKDADVRPSNLEKEAWDDEAERLEKIKQRENIGEYRERPTDNEVDWYDAENETSYDDEGFYKRKEFDDSRFRRREK